MQVACNECDFRTTGLKTLQNHMMKHNKMCTNCGNYVLVNSLAKHKESKEFMRLKSDKYYLGSPM